MAWIKASTLDDLPAGGSLEFTSQGRIYALFRSGDAIACLDGLCPHQAGRLALGRFDGSTVTCPRLGCLRWSFDVWSGACPVVGAGLTRRLYPVKLEARTILVDLPEP